MKPKSIFGIIFLFTAALSMIMASLAPSIGNQRVFATLLDGSIQNDQNDLGKLLIQNETGNGGTEDQGTVEQDQQDVKNSGADQILNSGTSEDDTQVSKGQSDIVTQDIKDTALLERIFPDILAKLKAEPDPAKDQMKVRIDTLISQQQDKIHELSNKIKEYKSESLSLSHDLQIVKRQLIDKDNCVIG